MRIIVHGLGAIGGAVAGALARSGTEVVGIARGAQLRAVRDGGLRIHGVDETFSVRVDCVGHPAEIAFREDDIILLCLKAQDTAEALQDLRAAGVIAQPVFCTQNGVDNERMAARLFDNVHGVTVLMPNTFVTPGVIGVHGHPKFGVFELGRFPAGRDGDDDRLAAALWAADIAAYVEDDVMAGKYSKLLMNSTNILDIVLGPGHRGGTLAQRVEAEGRAVFAASGVVTRDVSASDPRRQQHLRIGDVPDVPYIGSSTAQSLARGTGRLETDWLNGELCLMGRLHGVPVPANALLTRLAARLASGALQPGALEEAALLAQLPD